MKAAGVILAAGRGSRMKGLTDDRPKCMLELAGRPLLHWQTEALREAGISRLLVVRGYNAAKIQGDFETVENPRWHETNMLSSLLCAGEFARSAFASGHDRLVISYSDIVYHPSHAGQLACANTPIAIAYDTMWHSLWNLRFGDKALDDAETFRQLNGRLLEIGGKTGNLSDIQGQYMGLLSFGRAGWDMVESACSELGDKVDKTDMTSFLRHLLAMGTEIEAVPVNGKWCEADSGDDLIKYEQALISGCWSHDWR